MSCQESEYVFDRCQEHAYRLGIIQAVLREPVFEQDRKKLAYLFRLVQEHLPVPLCSPLHPSHPDFNQLLENDTSFLQHGKDTLASFIIQRVLLLKGEYPLRFLYAVANSPFPMPITHPMHPENQVGKNIAYRQIFNNIVDDYLGNAGRSL